MLLTAGFILLVSMGIAQEQSIQASNTTGKFVACENHAGGGFYWIDTTCGKLWWSDIVKSQWLYVGQPKDAKIGEVGTYVPLANKNGGGLFILNTSTGEGWWAMSGHDWKSFGKPKEELQLPLASYTNRTTEAGSSSNQD